MLSFSNRTQVLGYFTHQVKLPFLNCVDEADQAQLLQILSVLY